MVAINNTRLLLKRRIDRNPYIFPRPTDWQTERRWRDDVLLGTLNRSRQIEYYNIYGVQRHVYLVM